MTPARPGPRTIVLTSTIHGHVHVMMVLFAGVQMLMASEFGRSHAQIGMIGTFSYLAFGLGAPVAGHLADRFGARHVLEAMLGGAALSCLAIAWSPSVEVLATGLVCLGLSASLYHPAGLGLISRAARRGKALASHGIGGSFGLAAGPLVGSGLAAALGGSWRAPYAAAALACLVLLGGIAWDAARNRREPAPEPDGSAPPPERTTRVRELVTVLMAMTALGLVYRGTLTFLPETLGEALAPLLPAGSAVVVGGLVTSLALMLGVVGQWTGGAVLFHRFRLEVLYLALLLPCALGLVFLATGGPWWMVAGAALFGFFLFAAQPVGNGLLASYTSEARRSTGYGVHFLLAFGFGSLGAWLAGLAIDHWGRSAAFLAMLPFASAALLLTFLLIRRGAGGRD